VRLLGLLEPREERAQVELAARPQQLPELTQDYRPAALGTLLLSEVQLEQLPLLWGGALPLLDQFDGRAVRALVQLGGLAGEGVLSLQPYRPLIPESRRPYQRQVPVRRVQEPQLAYHLLLQLLGRLPLRPAPLPLFHRLHA
jgi:hypothetical protein